MTSSTKDTLFSTKLNNAPQFTFDDKVAPVFADMINRSVPGYASIIELLGTITRQFTQPDCRYYDLGCSLGASMLAMGQSLENSVTLCRYN